MKSIYNFVFLFIISLNSFATTSFDDEYFEKILSEKTSDNEVDYSVCDTLSGGFLIPNDSLELMIFDPYVCFGDSIEVDFPLGDFSRYKTFSWLQNDQVIGTDSSIIISEEDTFRFELYGCDTLSTDFELIYYTSNEGDSIFPDLEICKGDSIEVNYPRGLTGGYSSYRWFYEDRFLSSSLGTIVIKDAGTYSLELYGCDTIRESFTLTTVEINKTPYSFSDTVICPAEDNYILFPEGDFSTYKEFNWLYNGDFYSKDSTILVKEEGKYGLEFKGCDDKYRTFDVIHQSTDLSFIYDHSICFGDTVEIDIPEYVFEFYPEWYWYKDSVKFSQDTSFFRFEPGNYSLELYGCDTLVKDFEISYGQYNGCDCQIEMPNFFSPNGDNNNDVFKPRYSNSDAENHEICTSTEYKLEIFNQWGKNIFSSTKKDELPDWDGKNSRGVNRVEGLYYYRIQYKLNTYPPDVKHDITGYFHIYR